VAAPAIRVSDLWKEYAVGRGQDHYASTFYDLLASSLKRPFGRRKTARAQRASNPGKFWALRDINFEVQPGQVVGIIGRNGAGKSTLLKVLSRITAPTRGRVEVRGRLASLLEVGTGFHPELSGRENIFLNGSILGMPRKEVARKLESIVDFAEVDKFIDTPVKRYSSGMYVRLAFSVAAHLDPDILIVDEVLAVGDADFQRKCIGQMESISKQGRTLLVVSHNMQLIQKLCPTAILLDKGGVIAAGSVADVQPKYLAAGAGGASAWSPDRRDGEAFQYERVEIVPPAGYSANALPADQPFEIEFRFGLTAAVSGRLALKVRNQFGVVVFTSCDTDSEPFMSRRWQRGEYVERCTIPPGLLVPGQYWLTISRPLGEADEILEDICCFVVDRMGSLTERDNREGVIAPALHWHAGATP
jgi:lipopolysaccharide transport system ATP-binding protein